MSKQETIRIKGASEHNLDNLDLEIPKNQLVAITGPSGSGKSSLAFDTLFREGQRRYLETLSQFARRYVEKMDRPEVEEITGLSPACAVGQRGVFAQARSTVGTLSETYDYARILFGRLGKGICPGCGASLEARNPQQIAETVIARYPGSEIEVWSPLVEDHKGARRQLLERLALAGFTRIRLDDEELPLDPLPQMDETRRHTLEVSTGTMCANETQKSTLIAAVEKAVRLAPGRVKITRGSEALGFDAAQACPGCGDPFPAIGPRLFSFNNVLGACDTCKGLGLEEFVSEEKLISDPAKTLREGALVPTTPNGYIVYSQVTVDVMDEICRAHGFDVDTPFEALDEQQRRVIFYGSDRLQVPFGKHALASRMKWSGIVAKPREVGYYKGLVPVIAETLKRNRNKNILRFVESRQCGTCKGSRLSHAARSVWLGDLNICALAGMPFSEVLAVLPNLPLSERATALVQPVLEGLERRLRMLCDLGLGYLTMDRPSESLSGGEGRRLRLAREVGMRLRGMLYVLDEPGMGLHRRDKERLMDVLFALRDRGNSVLYVEHDLSMLAAGDWLLDLGPGAGRHGGKLLYQGPPQGIVHAPKESLTRAYLSGERSIPLPCRRRTGHGTRLVIRGARIFNLKEVDVAFPLGVFNVVTGVSGAGKSNLVDRILAKALKQYFQGIKAPMKGFDGLEGAEHLNKVIHIDQAPIGRTPRSNPATYTGVFDPIRALFARQEAALAAGWGKGHFSMNNKGGRCETCQGAGQTVIGMHGLPDVAIRCEVCEGRRFNEEILSIRLKGKNIRDVLDLTVAEAYDFFTEEKTISRILKAMDDVGLGYITLGQSSLTLSGGEAQRIKLAAELARPATGKTLYILDEPTTGLHPCDVAVLLIALDRLVDRGNTVIAVEHNRDVMKCADHLVDLGPESGDQGGYVVASGTPEEVAEVRASHTGRVLREVIHGEQSCSLSKPTAQATCAEPEAIRLEGVTTHNLKAVDVAIPVNQLTVITGVSGSGKSSLAFDTLYAESRGRFAESLSTQVRRSMARGRRGDATAMEGLFPAVAVGRTRGSRNNRSTVGTNTGVSDYLRLLFARLATCYCPDCGRVLKVGFCEGCSVGREISASTFSFNHHQGACEPCSGVGRVERADPELLVSFPEQSLLEGAMDGHKTSRFYGDPHGQYVATLVEVGRQLGLDFSKPWSQLDEHHRAVAMFGCGEREFSVHWSFKRGSRTGEHTFETTWKGFAALVDEEYARKAEDQRGEAMAGLMHSLPCESCAGTRLKKLSREARIEGKTLPDCQNLSMEQLDAFLAGLNHPIAVEVYAATAPCLRALRDVGLGYLSSGRRVNTLSGGEAQRVRLAGQLGGRLVGVTYVLDEPTVGLHPRDTDKLVALLRRLVDRGNTVVVVEHDETVIRSADFLLEMGPGAGEQGGEVVARGTIEDLKACGHSPTGRYLAGTLSMPVVNHRRTARDYLHFRGVSAHNLKGFDLRLPLGVFVAVAGVSGSGKSSLVFDVLAKRMSRGRTVDCSQGSPTDQLVCLDQMPLAGGGNALTTLGVFDQLRSLFAGSEDARVLGLKKSHFSFHNKEGRCPACSGTGTIKTGLDFLEDVQLPCEVCEGARYNERVLSVIRHGCSIAEILDSSVTEAKTLLREHGTLTKALALLEEVGLGYVRLGRDTRTLSGGEAQRLKLAREIWAGEKKGPKRLYLMDEPTTGLHFQDVALLLKMCHKLVDAGHSLVVIEHHQAVLDAADELIVLGPEGGEKGGYLTYQGPPERFK